MIPIVSRRDAMKRQIAHQHVPGMGYIVHSGPPDLPAEYPVGSKSCDPPAAAADGSVHLLKAPQGKTVPLRWIATERAWAALKTDAGNRMAWPIGFLSRAGWAYVGPKR